MRSINFICVILLGTPLASMSQTRVFISAGSSLSTDYNVSEFYSTGIGNAVWSTDGSYTTAGLKYFTFDVEVERRVSKFFVVSGVRLFNSGYNNSFSTNYSSFRSTHVGIPFLFRLNVLNYLYLDLGPMLISTVHANLNETALKGSVYETHDEKNITSYLTPVSLGFNIQYSIVVNRYFITGYFISAKNHVDENLKDTWALGGNLRNNSLFLRDMSPTHKIFLLGIKLGVRIK